MCSIVLHLRSLKKNYLFSFLAALSLCSFAQALSSCKQWGLLLIALCGLLIAAVSLVVEHGLWACRLQTLQPVGSRVCGLQLSWHTDSAVAADGPWMGFSSCSTQVWWLRSLALQCELVVVVRSLVALRLVGSS